MDWTTPEALKAQLQKRWERGVLLRELVQDSGLFPLRLAFKKPLSADLSTRFSDVRLWVNALRCAGEKGYQIIWKEVRHRVIGVNSLPAQVWVNSASEAIAILGLRKQAEAYQRLSATIIASQPALRSWLLAHPLRALEAEPKWAKFLAIIYWLQQNPRPDIYLRQLDLADIDSKFIERHRGILTELLNLTLPVDAIDPLAHGVKQFNRRFGFRDKPGRVRFRLSDIATSDKEIDSREFSQLQLSVSAVFIIENEISFLDFKGIPGSLVIFGRGYGFDMLAPALWLRHKLLYYWGDIDTHGFAILSQLRQLFPHTRSFLMDENTLLARRSSWGQETSPCVRRLTSLTEDEQRLYQALTGQHYGLNVRLEQEHIAASWIQQALENIRPR